MTMTLSEPHFKTVLCKGMTELSCTSRGPKLKVCQNVVKQSHLMKVFFGVHNIEYFGAVCLKSCIVKCSVDEALLVKDHLHIFISSVISFFNTNIEQ